MPSAVASLFTMKALLTALLLCVAASASGANVEAQRAPNGGIQPQAVVDASGTVHLVYFQGEAAGGNVLYVKRERGQQQFSKPTQVNSQPGSAIAAGSIRGAQMVLGKNGRVHVAWNGGKGAKRIAWGEKQTTPLLYTRLDDSGQKFEPERNVITQYGELDGGGSVAADSSGNVYVVWHGSLAENTLKEAGRTVVLAHSSDEGRSFSPEAPVLERRTGACGCCGLKAFADAKGAVYIAYRAATDNTERGETILFSPKPRAPFTPIFNDPWRASTCPMSSASIAATPTGAMFAWETGNEVKFARVDAETLSVSTPVTSLPGNKRKHPVAIRNSRGETLFVWSEGTAWAKGGSIAWQVYDATGAKLGAKGRADNLPVWSIPTAVAQPNGDFLIWY